jgi:hypothetical protein
MIPNNLIYVSACLDPQNNELAKKFQHLSLSQVYYEEFIPAPRSGTGPNPWNIVTLDHHLIPWPDQPYTYDFEETTDLRAQELIKILNNTHKPIVLFWSGGIDSTVALCAMIRNFDSALMNRLTVKLNSASYLENPYFFDNHIKGKINYSTDQFSYGDCICIHGNMADPLWIQRDVISMERWKPGMIRQSAITQPDDLINWLTNKCGAEHARWFYEMVVENSQSVGIDLLDYEDFYWWWNFNYCYAFEHYKSLVNSDLLEKSQIDLDDHFATTIPWYFGNHYQQWSLANRSNGVKYQNTVRSYKMPAKNYIFSVDKNPWYRDYKTKMASPGFNRNNKILYICKDGQFLLK